MSNNAKQDIIAVVLLGFVISILIIASWTNKTKIDPSHIIRSSDVSEQVSTFVRNYNSLTSAELLSAELDPQTFIDATVFAPDYGTANDLRYIAELITRYNDGANVRVTEEATAILNDVIPRIRETMKN